MRINRTSAGADSSRSSQGSDRPSSSATAARASRGPSGWLCCLPTRASHAGRAEAAEVQREIELLLREANSLSAQMHRNVDSNVTTRMESLLHALRAAHRSNPAGRLALDSYRMTFSQIRAQFEQAPALEVQPVTPTEPLGMDLEKLQEALSMLMGHHETTNFSEGDERVRLAVINHLQDIAERESELTPSVREVALEWKGDPYRLVCKLQELVNAEQQLRPVRLGP